MAENSIHSNHTQAIENYIQRVTELTQLGRIIPSQDELLKVTTELGITEAEIAIAQKQSQDHYTRAQGYVGIKHWSDAIEELEEAIAFNPFNLPMLHLLINAYLGRWQEKHSRQDEAQIRFRIKQCLEIQADDQESLKLLGKLDKYIQNYQYKIWSIGGICLIFSGTLIGFFALTDVPINWLNSNRKLEGLTKDLTQEIKKINNRLIDSNNLLLKKIREQETMNSTRELKLLELENKVEKLEQQNKELQRRIDLLNRGGNNMIIPDDNLDNNTNEDN